MSGLLSFATTDVDESIEIGSRLFYRHHVQPSHARSQFSYELTASQIGSLSVGQLSYGCEVKVTVGGQDESYGVSVPRVGPLVVSTGRSEFMATPRAASVGVPVGERTITGFAESSERLTMLKFDRRTLEIELGRLLGTDRSGVIHFSPLLDLRKGRGAEWWQFARTLLGSLDDPHTLTGSPIIAAQISSMIMTGLLLSTDHQYREALETRALRPTPAVIRRAVTFIEENAQRPITVPDIAAAVGASVRTLHRGFNEHLSSSPSSYLARVRMDAAHWELTLGNPQTTSVTQVATKWGFLHHGRFAGNYREVYGRSPSETLRQS